jgi:uncharacterized protein YbjQ (UPF0145 family)
MIMTTTFSVEGFRIREYLGIVRGVVVRAPTISQGFMGGLRTIVGGQIHEFTEMCEQTRQQATAALAQHGREMGANAIVGIGYDASEIGHRATEVLCYGTAVILEPATPASGAS